MSAREAIRYNLDITLVDMPGSVQLSEVNSYTYRATPQITKEMLSGPIGNLTCVGVSAELQVCYLGLHLAYL